LPKDIEKLAERLGDTKPLMEDLAGYFIKLTQKKWEIRGGGESYGGVQWPELAESTKKQKRSDKSKYKDAKYAGGDRRGDAHILIDYGHMHAALTKDVSATEAKIFFMSPEGKKYMQHHFGKGNVKKRVVLDITPEDEKALDKEAGRFVDKALSKR